MSVTVIDDFEDSDISEYNSYGDDNEFVVDYHSEYPYNGNYGLGCHIDYDSSGATSSFIASTSGLNYYPRAGDTINFWVKGSGEEPELSFVFGFQDGTNFYNADIVVGSSSYIRISKRVNDNFSIVESTSCSLSSDTWYMGRIVWTESGDIDFELYTAPENPEYNDYGDLIDSITCNDTTFTSGGIGFEVYGGLDVVDGYFDYVHIEGEPTAVDNTISIPKVSVSTNTYTLTIDTTISAYISLPFTSSQVNVYIPTIRATKTVQINAPPKQSASTTNYDLSVVTTIGAILSIPKLSISTNTYPLTLKAVKNVNLDLPKKTVNTTLNTLNNITTKNVNVSIPTSSVSGIANNISSKTDNNITQGLSNIDATVNTNDLTVVTTKNLVLPLRRVNVIADSKDLYVTTTKSVVIKPTKKNVVTNSYTCEVSISKYIDISKISASTDLYQLSLGTTKNVVLGTNKVICTTKINDFNLIGWFKVQQGNGSTWIDLYEGSD